MSSIVFVTRKTVQPVGNEVVLANPIVVEHPPRGMRHKAVELDRDLRVGPREVEVAALATDLHAVVDTRFGKSELAHHPEDLGLPEVPRVPELRVTLLEEGQHDRAAIASRRPQLLRSRFEASNVDQALDDRRVEHVLEDRRAASRPATSIRVRAGVVAGMPSTIVRSTGGRQFVDRWGALAAVRACRATSTSGSAG